MAQIEVYHYPLAIINSDFIIHQLQPSCTQQKTTKYPADVENPWVFVHLPWPLSAQAPPSSPAPWPRWPRSAPAADARRCGRSWSTAARTWGLPHPGEGLTPVLTPEKWLAGKEKCLVSKWWDFLWKKIWNIWLDDYDQLIWSIDVFTAFCSPIYYSYNWVTSRLTTEGKWNNFLDADPDLAYRVIINTLSANRFTHDWVSDRNLVCLTSRFSSLIASLVQSRNHSSTLSPANRMMACRPWLRPGRSLASLRTSLNSAWENTSDWCWTIQHVIPEAVLIPSQMINPIMNARRKKSNSEDWPWEWGDCLNLVNKLVLELFVTAMLKLGMPCHTPWMEESMLSLTSFAQTHWAISFRTTKA